MRIYAKLAASLLLTALFPLVLVAGIIYVNSKSTLVRVAQGHLDFSAATLAQRVLDHIENRYTDVESWSKLDSMQAVFTGDDVDLRLGLLLRDLRNTTDFANIWCVDSRGRVIASSDFSEVGESRGGRPAVDASLLGAPYLSGVEESPPGAPGPRWSIEMAHPIVGAFDDETIIGALVARFDWAGVQELVGRRTTGYDLESQDTILLDDAGRIVASSNPDRMLTNPGEMIQMPKDAITSVAHVNSPRLGVGYRAVASVRTDAVLASLRRLELNILVVCLMACVGVGLLALLLSRAIGSPIVRLSHNARKIAEGDLDVKLESQSADEIGELAVNLDAMRTSLKHHIDTLDAAVQARTHELQDTVAQLRQEISDREYAERQSRIQQQQLVQADKMVSLGILVSGVAHEINNPNALMGLNIPVIQEAWEKALPVLDEYCEEHGDISLGAMTYSEMRSHIPRLLAEMREGSDRIRAIVSDLKAFSRKHDEDEFEVVDINRVVESAVSLARKHLDDSTEHLELDLAQDLPGVMGVSQRLEQVVINLLLNACDALSNKQQAIRVETSLEPATHEVRIAISDEGCGIEPDDLPHVTDPFFTTKRTCGGTGLGLSISSGIVEEHRGTIRFHSVPGEGTTVVLSIPAIPMQAPVRS